MKTIRSILTASLALAMFSTIVHAEVFPIFEDTVGSPVTNTITKAAGAAKTMAISGKSTAYIGFAVGQSGIDPATVTAARLTVYFSTVTKPGTISLHQLTSGFTESFTEPKRPTPTAAAAFDNIPLTTALARDFFIIDVTTQVKAWLANPANDFGLAITGDATVACIIASKEGAASGHPAVIEIDVNRPGGTVAGTSAAFAGSLFLDTDQSNDGALGGNSIVFGGPGNGEGILSKRTAGDNQFGLDFFTGNAERMSITSAGNVGIGTTTPATRLGVAADAANAGVARFDNANAAGFSGIYFDEAGVNRGWTGYVNSGSSFGAPGTMEIAGARSDLVLSAHGAGFFQERMRIKADTGNIGIGTATPTQAKLVVIGSANTAAGQFGSVRYFNPQIDGTVLNWGGGAVSIYASDSIVAGGIGLFSDARIKNIIGHSDPTADLGTLRKIEITDYTMKDTVAKGTSSVKKVIAQQIEATFPQAVTRGTGIIPDIYKKAAIEGGWVQLATDLQPGDRVKLIGEGEEGVHEVTEVEKDRFRTASLPAGAQVFVFGREVNDLRRVDYDAIAMLNVSATQELARQLEAKDAEIATLKAANLALAAKMASFDEQLTALKASFDDRPARTVRASLDLK